MSGPRKLHAEKQLWHQLAGAGRVVVIRTNDMTTLAQASNRLTAIRTS